MYGERGKIGHICPSIPLDMIINEVQQMVPDGVLMVYSTLYIQQLRQEDFDRAIATLDEAAQHMVEGEAQAVIVGGGPVVAALGSDEAVVERTKAITKVPSISTTGAILAGIDHFGAKKIALATPYKQFRNDLLKDYLTKQGYEVVGDRCLGYDRAMDIAKLPFNATYELACRAAEATPDAEAIYMPCARMPVVGNIHRIEETTGKPVVTSTQAMVWWGLRAIGLREPVHGYGRLLAEVD